MTPESPDIASEMEELAARFEIGLLEEHAGTHPGDVEALRQLAYAYSSAGRHADAVEADLRLVRMAPDRPELHYDLACSLALVGRADDAFERLSLAVALGFRGRHLLLADPDFVSLHDDPRWRALLARLPE